MQRTHVFISPVLSNPFIWLQVLQKKYKEDRKLFAKIKEIVRSHAEKVRHNLLPGFGGNLGAVSGGVLFPIIDLSEVVI